MIPKEMRDLPYWVVDGCKVPYNPNTIKKHREVYKHFDPTTYGTYEECKALLEEHKALGLHIFDGLGFSFNKENGIICIDIDRGTNEDGTINDLALEIINKFNSYTEWSVHHRGFHIYVKGELDTDKYHTFNYGIEVCGNGWTYLTTDDPYLDVPLAFNQEAIDWLLDNFFDKEKDIVVIKENSERE